MQTLNLSPGAPIFDLSFRQAPHRRLALLYGFWWFCVVAAGITGLFMKLDADTGSRWSLLSWGLAAALFSMILALGSSVAAGSTALAGWTLITLAAVGVPWNQAGWVKYTVGAVTVLGSLLCLRFERKARVLRVLCTLLAAPLLAIPTWIISICFVIGVRFTPLLIAIGRQRRNLKDPFLALLESFGYLEYIVGGTYDRDPTPFLLLSALALGSVIAVVFSLATLLERPRT
jgi:hypothetical protein